MPRRETTYLGFSRTGGFEITTFATLAEAREHAFPNREAAQAVVDTQLPKLQKGRYEIVDFEMIH